MSEKTETIESNDAAVENNIDLPPECRVIFYNDDYTEKRFVENILEYYFAKSSEEALFLTEKIQEEGKASVGTYTYDIAATRTEIAIAKAKRDGFPLRIEVKK